MVAYDFEYAGRRLSDFNCILCRFDSVGVETISNGSQISFNTIPTLNGSKHNSMGAMYEDCLEATLQICKHSCLGGTEEISSVEFRELTRWLNKKRFLKFKIINQDYIDLYFEATFNISRIEVGGRLYGLELQMITNRPFALKEPKIISISSNKAEKVHCWKKFNKVSDTEDIMLGYVTSKNINDYSEGVYSDNHTYTYIGEVNKMSIHDISHEEGYIYPYTEITMLKDGDLKIYNAIESRETYIKGCKKGEVITMDYPVIKTSDPSHKIENDFNWNFFRVANTFENSKNDIIAFTPCEIKIKYSPIVKVGL